jgi:ribosomal protein L29
MSKVNDIILEMKQLEWQIEALKKELLTLQTNCNHVFVSNTLMKQCVKCNQSESIYY